MLDAVVGAAASTQRSVTGSAFIRTCRVAIPGVMLAFLLGCASTSRQPAVPESDTARAQIPGMPGVRYVVPEGIAGFEPDVLQAAAAEQQARSRAGATGPLPPATGGSRRPLQVTVKRSLGSPRPGDSWPQSKSIAGSVRSHKTLPLESSARR